MHGNGPADLREHCLAVAAYMILLARHPEGDAPPYALAEYMAEADETVRSGKAFAKFREMVVAQGGDPRQVEDVHLLPKAALVETLYARHSGYVAQLNAAEVGMAAVDLGAGRERKGDLIDHAVGIMVHKKVGQEVHQNEPIFTLYANHPERLARAKARLEHTLVVSEQETPPLPTFYDTIIG